MCVGVLMAGLMAAPAASAFALVWGCPHYDGSGSGSLNAHGHSESASGQWWDGCGGGGCDDSVTGTSGSRHFQIQEMPGTSPCRMSCNLDGHAWQTTSGQVSPGHNGWGSARWVDFGCNGGGAYSFSGSLRN